MKVPAVLALVLVALLAAPRGLGGSTGPFDFEDVTDAAGIHFRHAASPDQYTYPEVNGGGVCVGDVNGDGIEDVFLVNGLYANQTLQAKYDPRSALYLGNGDGTFTDASAAWGADVSGWYMGCSMADYDGDGRLDVLLVGYGTILLLKNVGDHFVDATAASGLTEDGKCGEGSYCFGTGSCWGDYDRDGRIDLYVTNYVDWNIDAGGPASPNLYDGQPGVMWHNNGDGTFTDVTAATGTSDAPGPNHSKAFQCSFADYNRDGWPDLYVASDTTPNTLFRNNGDGTFTDVAAAAGVDDSRASMGLSFQPTTASGLPDVYVANFEGEHSGYFVNRGDGTFADLSGSGGLAADTCCIHWGTGFFDFDQDGRKDLYSISGGVSKQIPDEKSLVWHREADGSFTNVTGTSGPAFQESFTGRGAAVLDAFLDGAPDLIVVANFNETARLWHNEGARGHWLEAELRSPSSPNVDAVGAEVTITPAGGDPETTLVQAGSSYLSSNTPIVDAGLGNATSANVTVLWPDGSTQTWAGVGADMRVRLTEGNANVGLDTISPLTTLHANGTAGDNGWLRSPALITLDARDRALGVPSGVAVSDVAVDGAPLAPYAGAFTVGGDGVHDVAARSVDNAGNVEPLRHLTVRIDTTPPVSTSDVQGALTPSGWYRGFAVAHVTATDATSGVDHVETRLDGGPWSDTATLLVARGGAHVLEYRSVDKAGNVETPRARVIQVDRDLPTVALPPLTAGAGDALVVANASDASSGVATVAFYLDGSSTPAQVDQDGSDGWTFDVTTPGSHVVEACATDRVGFVACGDGLAIVG